MKAEDKAKELVEKFAEYSECVDYDGYMDIELQTGNAKQCALICVEEILRTYELTEPNSPMIDYWTEVKTSIEKL